MSGTNFTKGVAMRTKFAGSTAAATAGISAQASTKFIRRQAVIHCVGSEATAELQTGFTFPANVIVHDVYLFVHTVDATETVDVGTQGTSNDPDGLLDGASLATVGLVKGSLATGGQARGALLRVDESGTGILVPEASVAVGGDPVSITTSAGTDTAVFDVIIDFTEVVDEVN